MTLKDDLHALVDSLDEADAREVLDYVQALTATPFTPSPEQIEEIKLAFEETRGPNPIYFTQEEIEGWLRTVGTPEEEAASRALDEREAQMRKARADAAAST